MKKTLIILVLLFSTSISSLVWSAGGVDCTDVKTPDFSKLGFTMVEKTVYDDQGLGVSFHYQSKYGSLTYYSFDLDFKVLDQPLLDKMLNQGVRDIRYKLSLNKNILFEDQISLININSSWNLWNMKNFINKGAYISSTAKTSKGNQSIIDIITVGTDKKCIKKIRWSSNLDPDWKPNPIVYGLRNFELFLTDFYNVLEKNINTDTYNGALAYKGQDFARNKDFATTLEIWTPLAEQGDAFSQLNLGYMYKHGNGVNKDINKAAELFERAATQGNPKAQYEHGMFFYVLLIRGHDIKKNYKEAKKWLELAAEQEEVVAQGALGALYNKGDGSWSKDDFLQSLRWYKRAAENGDDGSQFMLGIYYLGRYPGIPRNPLLAYMWMRIAYENGNKYAEEEYESITKLLNLQKRLEDGIKLYNECVKKNLKGC